MTHIISFPALGHRATQSHTEPHRIRVEAEKGRPAVVFWEEQGLIRLLSTSSLKEKSWGTKSHLPNSEALLIVGGKLTFHPASLRISVYIRLIFCSSEEKPLCAFDKPKII
jgi:hypothetical protein